MSAPSVAPGILVVEDEYIIAHELAQALEAAGALVVGPAGNIQQAIGHLRRGPHIQVAVLDIRLGDDLVYPVADLLSENDIPFIFFSGCDEIVLPDRFQSAPLVSKDLGLNELVSVVLDAQLDQGSGRGNRTDAEPPIMELLPYLRAYARSLEADQTLADEMVGTALQQALANVERCKLGEPARKYLYRTIRHLYERRKGASH